MYEADNSRITVRSVFRPVSDLLKSARDFEQNEKGFATVIKRRSFESRRFGVPRHLPNPTRLSSVSDKGRRPLFSVVVVDRADQSQRSALFYVLAQRSIQLSAVTVTISLDAAYLFDLIM